MLGMARDTRGPGCYAQGVIRKIRFPGLGAADGAAVPVAEETDLGYTAVFSDVGRVVTVTGPKAKRATLLYAGQLVGGATATLSRTMVPSAWSPTTGTYTFSCFDATVLEAPLTTDMLEIVFLIDEGSS
jgi:hypothetical protein